MDTCVLMDAVDEVLRTTRTLEEVQRLQMLDRSGVREVLAVYEEALCLLPEEELRRRCLEPLSSADDVNGMCVAMLSALLAWSEM